MELHSQELGRREVGGYGSRPGTGERARSRSISVGSATDAFTGSTIESTATSATSTAPGSQYETDIGRGAASLLTGSTQATGAGEYVTRSRPGTVASPVSPDATSASDPGTAYGSESTSI